jgi:hypothetical protein
MNSLNYILGVETPGFIPFADKPLRLGGTIEQLTIEQFKEKLGIIYKEGISVESKINISQFKENINGNVSAYELKKQVEKELKDTGKKLVVCKMDKVGYGVFASTDIRKDTVVAIYSGTITMGLKVSSESDYALSYYGTNLSFSTAKHRGIASFMQHLPEKPKFENAEIFSNILKGVGQNVSKEELKLNIEMYSTKFQSSKTRELVAIENIRREYLNFNGIPVIAMVTDQDIKSGDQLGFNYGYQYWLSRKITPEFFDKNGQALSYKLYKRVFGQLNFDNFSYTGDYQPLINLLVNSSKQKDPSPIIITGDDKKPHEVSVGQLMVSLLSVNACTIEIDPLCKYFLLERVFKIVTKLK